MTADFLSQRERSLSGSLQSVTLETSMKVSVLFLVFSPVKLVVNRVIPLLIHTHYTKGYFSFFGG